MLAAHSLVLTVLNGHYVAKRFSHISYPNKNNAIRVLAGLQQSPLRVSNLDEGLLASLIVLPQNDKWWIRMTKLMNYQHTWSIPAIASIAWVVVAYFFTVADSFSEVPTTFHANGQGVGCLWLWVCICFQAAVPRFIDVLPLAHSSCRRLVAGISQM